MLKLSRRPVLLTAIVLAACSSSDKTTTDGQAGTPVDGSVVSDPDATGGGTDAAKDGVANSPDGKVADTAAVTGDTGTANSMMSFFITSRTGDGNLGGLTGADTICQTLAEKVGAGGKTWHAYLSTNTPKVDAKSRIGTGPWYNVKGIKIADDLDGLHKTTGMNGDTPGSMLNGTTALTETAGVVPLANPNEHDILTGTNIDGTAAAALTCMDWTGTGVARVGHYNRMGGGDDPNSWNAAHDNAGCTADTIKMKGGAGRFYCFAIN